jgi:signal transduction histidine kinase
MIRQLRQVSVKTKILQFALILIILPSGILGYFGFRAIENRGFRLKENYQGMVRLMRDKLETQLLELERIFLQDVSNKNWDQDVQTIKNLLNQIQEKHSIIEELFIMDSDGRIFHPKIILYADGLNRSELLGLQAVSNEFIELGERSEFIADDCPAALRYYEQAMEQADSDQFRFYARMLVARCYFKMKNYVRAEAEYRLLFEQSGKNRSPEGTPFKIIGLNQLAEMYASLGEEKNKLETLIALYEELIDSPGAFESFDFYLETVKSELTQISQELELEPSDLSRLEKLREEEQIQMARARYLRLVYKFLFPQLDFNAAIDDKAQTQISVLPPHYTIQDSGRKMYRVGYTFLPSSSAQTGQQVLVYRFDEDWRLTEFLSDIGEESGLGEKVQVGIVNEEGSLVYPTETASPALALASTNLLQFFPQWRLVLFDKKGKNVEYIVRREKQLYCVALFSIFLLILTGIVMTMKAATHEADMARLKSEFVSNVSHELKTPLALIRLFGETLEMDQVKDAEKRKKFSGIIARESQRLSYLIDNVLNFSKIESGQKEYMFEKEDLVRLVSSTLEAYKFYLKDHGFEIDVSVPESPVFIEVDKDAISQALLNLLSNAEKYSMERKYIGVKVIPKDNEVCIAVEDRGPGIPKPNLKHIFDKFYRGEHSASRDVQGSGLGLTIVKHIVESHGGQISVESEVGEGTRFTIKLPIKENRIPPEKGAQD